MSLQARPLGQSWPGKSLLRGIPRSITTHGSNANDFGLPTSATRTGAACRMRAVMRHAACGICPAKRRGGPAAISAHPKLPHSHHFLSSCQPAVQEV